MLSGQLELAVADCELHRVNIYDALTLKYKRGFGELGDSQGEFSFPYSVCATEHEIFVADVANHRIQAFTHGGQFLREIGGEENVGGADLTSPRGVAIVGDAAVGEYLLVA